MKLHMLWAWMICIALSVSAAAQKPLSDTIAITPFPDSKVLLIGPDMNKLVKENNFELLKNGFITDMKESAKDADFPANAKEAIYLVAADGRRRIKAKPEELTPFDTDKEISTFSAGLPPVHYTIYDLRNAMEYHIYLKDPQQLDLLSAINFTTIQMPVEAQGKSVSKVTKLEVERENNEWQVIAPRPIRSATLELYAGFNASLFNSTLSPGISGHVDFLFLTKHRTPRYKIGTAFTLNALGEFQDYKFKNLHLARGVDIRLMKNYYTDNSRPLWYGILIGHIRRAENLDSLPSRSLSNRFKFGIAADKGHLGVEYAFIPATRTEPSLQNLTFRFRL
jgi:hypothetical protein